MAGVLVDALVGVGGRLAGIAEAKGAPRLKRSGPLTEHGNIINLPSITRTRLVRPMLTRRSGLLRLNCYLLT